VPTTKAQISINRVSIVTSEIYNTTKRITVEIATQTVKTVKAPVKESDALRLSKTHFA
jgi:hypothetical protein